MLSNNMNSFPTELLLYIPKKMAGLRFKCPTDIITSSKLAIAHRAQLQSTDAATAKTSTATLEQIPRRPINLPYG